MTQYFTPSDLWAGKLVFLEVIASQDPNRSLYSPKGTIYLPVEIRRVLPANDSKGDFVSGERRNNPLRAAINVPGHGTQVVSIEYLFDKIEGGTEFYRVENSPALKMTS